MLMANGEPKRAAGAGDTKAPRRRRPRRPSASRQGRCGRRCGWIIGAVGAGTVMLAIAFGAVAVSALPSGVLAAPAAAGQLAEDIGKGKGKTPQKPGAKLPRHEPKSGGGTSQSTAPQAAPKGGAIVQGPFSADEQRILAAMLDGSRILRALNTDAPDWAETFGADMLSLHRVLADESPQSSPEQVALAAGFTGGLALATRLEREYMLRGTDDAVVAYQRVLIDVMRDLLEVGAEECFGALIEDDRAPALAAMIRRGDDIDRVFAALIESSAGRAAVTEVDAGVTGTATALTLRIIERDDLDSKVIEDFFNGDTGVSGMTVSQKETFCRFLILTAEAFVDSATASGADIIRWSYLNTSGDGASSDGQRNEKTRAPGKGTPRARPPAGKTEVAATETSPDDAATLADIYGGSRILSALIVDDPSLKPEFDESLLSAYQSLDNETGKQTNSDLFFRESVGFRFGLKLANELEAEYMLRGDNESVLAYRQLRQEELKRLAGIDPDLCYERLTGADPNAEHVGGGLLRRLDGAMADLIESADGREAQRGVPSFVNDIARRWAIAIVAEQEIDVSALRRHLIDGEPADARVREDLCTFVTQFWNRHDTTVSSANIDGIRWDYLNETVAGMPVFLFDDAQ